MRRAKGAKRMTEQQKQQEANGRQARWRMNRVGIFNFWYYEDQEIELQDGRLILRGANGSGKSVTMQSFLPLVLDGDKRPHRLDPFGSKDRRIDYYLLGEAESGKQDVTGYLWMEFEHSDKQLYKTIGIGLRARRGAAQVGFWGFLLEDGRRIGRDFWLYDRAEWVESGAKVPLGRRDLAEKIGSGGQVVQEQAAYRDLVNKALFGFAEVENYQDLLQLLVQLRSPKLSKDFKPTSMYEILTSALPPLHDDDLRPLSEVLEDMDQITDRLDELRLHRRDMAKLQEQYDRYNRFQLYLQAGRLLEKEEQYEKQARLVRETEREHAQAELEKSAAERALLEIGRRIAELQAELELLDQHEAIEKQREYESLQQQLADKQKYAEQTNARIRQNRYRLDKYRDERDSAARKLEQLGEEQTELLEELDRISKDIEFAEHNVYHRQWMNGYPEEDHWREPWRRDLKRHGELLEHALAIARSEREAHRAVQEVERQLGEASKVREQAEWERVKLEEAFESAKDAYRETLLQWRNGLKVLQVPDESVRAILSVLREYGPQRQDTEPFRRPIAELEEAQRSKLLERRSEWLERRRQLLEQAERLAEEKREWETSPEPEPNRTEPRSRSRANRSVGQGAPLFEVCDFQPHLTETQQARLEEALERAGLLDAWIANDGRFGKLGADEEEVWIVPSPHVIGYTLADVLVPVLPEESGLKPEVVDEVLRSILWEEGDDVDAVTDGLAVVGVNGQYRLGPLVGKIAEKPRAEYIGRETRRRTRLLEIARLQTELDKLQEAIADCDRQLSALEEKAVQLKEESRSMPGSQAIKQALDALLMVQFRLEALVQEENRIQERVRVKMSEWRALQLKLIEATSCWSRLKREQDLQDACARIKDYEHMLTELYSAWSRHADAANRLQQIESQLKELEELLEDDLETFEELEEDCHILDVQIQKLKQLMEELGIADLVRQKETLKVERTRLFAERDREAEVLKKADRTESALSERLRGLRERLSEWEQAYREALADWHGEMKCGLVREWTDIYQEELSQGQISKLCREILSRYDSSFNGRNPEAAASTLLEHFNGVRLALTDYVLETAVDERSGRISIFSMRDRNHPHPPHIVLEELEQLEQEQSQLLSEKDRELYEEIILRSVGKAIRNKIHRAEQWVKRMNRLMEQRQTSSGLRLKLEWIPRAAQNEQQLNTERLVELLKRDAHRLHDEEIDQIIAHFRSHISYAKHEASEEKASLRKYLYELLDYRGWFQFELKYAKGEQLAYRPLTDSRFNVLSGGEKAMAMYIPLFAATYSRYSDGRPDAPRIISLDEAFAGVDEENVRDLFKLLTEMDFDYMMTSQVLWGCYDTVPKLAIYEIHRPKDADWVALFHYRWNGKYKEFIDQDESEEAKKGRWHGRESGGGSSALFRW